MCSLPLCFATRSSDAQIGYTTKKSWSIFSFLIKKLKNCIRRLIQPDLEICGLIFPVNNKWYRPGVTLLESRERSLKPCWVLPTFMLCDGLVVRCGSLSSGRAGRDSGWKAALFVLRAIGRSWDQPKWQLSQHVEASCSN